MVADSWEWMGAPDAAKYLGIALRTLYRLIDVGDVPAFQIGRVIRLRRHELDDYLDRTRLRPGDLAARQQYVAQAQWSWSPKDEREMGERLNAFLAAYSSGGPGVCPLCGDVCPAGEAPRHFLGHRVSET